MRHPATPLTAHLAARLGLLAMLVAPAVSIWAAPEPEPEVKSGTVTGTVAEVGDKAVVVVDGAGKRWRFIPEWVGGAPKDGGHLDETILKAIRSLQKDQKVTITWKFEEHYRALKIEAAKN